MACPSECPRLSAFARPPPSRPRGRPRPWPSRPLDHLGERSRLRRRRVAGCDRRALRLEGLEQPLVAERGHLDRLREGRPALPRVERGEHRDVHHDRRGLVERADEVLALGQVDAGLATDRRVELGNERRRDLDEGHAPQVGGGEEPGRRRRARRHRRRSTARRAPREGGPARWRRPRRSTVASRPRPGGAAPARPPAEAREVAGEPGAEGCPCARLGNDDRPPRAEVAEREIQARPR